MIQSIKDLREALSLRDVIRILSGRTPLTSKIRCPMPSHPDGSPSFNIYSTKGGDRYRCWGASCGVRGDALDFVKTYQNYATLEESVAWVHANRTLLGLEDFSIESILSEYLTERKHSDFWVSLMECMKHALLEAPGFLLREWLEERGVVGCVHELLPIGCFFHDYLLSNGFTEEQFAEYNLPHGKRALKDPALAFFYYSTPVTLSKIKLRFFKKKEASPLVLGGPSANLGFFGLDLITPDGLDDVTWVEGEVDLLVPQSQSKRENNEFLSLICCSGAGMTSRAASEILANHRVKRLNLWPDNDPPGRALVHQVVRAHARPSLHIQVYWPEDYINQDDPNEKIDPADYCKAKQSIDSVLAELTQSAFYVADWLAEEACRKFTSLRSPSREDVIKLQNLVLEICQDARLVGTDLGNFIRNVCDKCKVLNYDVMFSCASAGLHTMDTREFSLGGRRFVAHERGYHSVTTAKDGEVKETRVSDFRVQLDRWVQVEDPLENEPRTFGMGYLVRAGKARPITLSDRDFSSFEKFSQTIHSVDSEAIMDGPTFRSHHGEIIKALNQGTPQVKGTLTIGHIRTKGLPDMYLFPKWYAQDGKLYPNEEIPVIEGEAGTSSLMRLAHTDLVTDRKYLTEVAHEIGVDLFSYYSDRLYPMCIMGHFAASPIVEMLTLPKGILYLEGAPGQGKTLSVSILMNMCWDYPQDAPKLNFYSTINSVERELAYFKGIPAFLDDAKAEYLQRHKGDVLRLIQSYFDRQGRGRMNRSGSLQRTSIVNAHLAITGESLPLKEESALTRMVVLNWRKGTCDHEGLVEHIIPKMKRWNSLWPHYVAWLQRRPDLSVKNYSANLAGRLQQFINNIGTGLEYYLVFLSEEFGIPRPHVTALLDELKASNKSLYHSNIEIQKSLNEGTLFVETLAEILCSNYKLIDSDNPLEEKLGWREGNVIYIYPTKAIRRVALELGGREFSKMSLTNRLMDDGYLAQVSNNLRDGEIRPKASDQNPSRKRVWAIIADKLFQGFTDPANNPNYFFNSFGGA